MMLSGDRSPDAYLVYYGVLKASGVTCAKIVRTRSDQGNTLTMNLALHPLGINGACNILIPYSGKFSVVQIFA